MLLTFRRTTAPLRPSRLLSTQPTTISPPPTTVSPPHPLTKPQLKTLILSHYNNGKFSNLLQNVVASPSVLLTAAHNLTHENQPTINSISTNFFNISQMSDDLINNTFKIESCVIKLTNKGTPSSLNVPNLNLKVLIESIRIVLEVVYDDRFATFSYGGRVGMGRATAIRYLKNVENPTWWFNVSFRNKEFGVENVNKLCLVIKEKVSDDMLIDVIRRLFDLKIILVEFAGCYLGRGFPNECGLCAILINVYLNVFDQKLQELRLLVNEESRKARLENENDGDGGNVVYKPLKIYAVRYLDEILVITSGSKGLTVKLKNLVVPFLEKNLALEVNKGVTAVHSAVSEEIRFLGMDVRAVTPSVLRSPMSEKAIRARKKYLRQKEVRLQELKNRRETNRKKLAMKIFDHVYKKLKTSNGFKFNFQIEKEVKEIFETWGRETVDEFMGSTEERAALYRKLSGGDFLSLKRIREQLPLDLVESYDKFQENVDKYLNPMKARKEMEERKRKLEDEEEKKYAERTVKDLTKLCIKVDAPDRLVRQAIRLARFTNDMGRPRPIGALMVLEDADIIKWHAGVGKRWLDYFCCCHNFKIVKTVVNYHMRFSCILTLAEKHESTKREAIKHYTKDLRVFDVDGNEELYFPSEREIKMMGDKNLVDPKPVDGALTMLLTRLATDENLYRCGAHFCQRFDTIVYRIRLLQKDLNLDCEKSWVSGMGVIPDVFDRKCVPLCSDHVSQMYLGALTLQDVDFSSLLDVCYLAVYPFSARQIRLDLTSGSTESEVQQYLFRRSRIAVPKVNIPSLIFLRLGLDEKKELVYAIALSNLWKVWLQRN
ncbi:putative domain X protein [Helianthus annuus]|nr:putative domain X protein [Helianthus annuus]KAJ0662630.1 putative domain X protein [Helianthus annuus]KAJ0670141.1 putative domain X protein [Helianthus annuus]